jgi:hypothetical protein
MRIYFAGKIGRGDWRCQLFSDYRAGVTPECGGDDQASLIDPAYAEDKGGGVIYTGLFFIGCDHGCAHGPTSHGVGAGQEWYDPRHNPEPDKDRLVVCANDVTAAGKVLTRSDIFQANNARIRQSDWVFAYIDDVTAYGTLFEIGYALARSVRVAVAFPEDLMADELWYIQQAAKKVYRGTPANTFEQFCKDVGLWWRSRPRRAA